MLSRDAATWLYQRQNGKMLMNINLEDVALSTIFRYSP